MFAVIKTGGKQYQVAANDVIPSKSWKAKPATKIEFTEVLVVGEGATPRSARRL